MKPVFELNEFVDDDGYPMEPVEVVAYTNAKIQKLIDEAQVIQGFRDHQGDMWFTTRSSSMNKIQGYLMFPEPIKKECVKHEPEHTLIDSITNKWLTKCKHCSVSLYATWTERK